MRGRSIPKEKRTSLGLYATAREAFEQISARPNATRLIDVRTPEEAAFVGRPEMALTIPLMVLGRPWRSGDREPPFVPNPDFIDSVKHATASTDTLFLMCRSGGRSAKAVDQLAAAGVRRAYTITDGFEGDVVDDPDSNFLGQRMKNGWKCSGLPWTYAVDPGKVLVASLATTRS